MPETIIELSNLKRSPHVGCWQDATGFVGLDQESLGTVQKRPRPENSSACRQGRSEKKCSNEGDEKGPVVIDRASFQMNLENALFLAQRTDDFTFFPKNLPMDLPKSDPS